MVEAWGKGSLGGVKARMGEGASKVEGGIGGKRFRRASVQP